MRFISWNVNGLRACLQKGFLDFFHQIDADFFCLQETKLQEGQVSLELPGYEQFWCYAEKKGYSGTAIFAKHTPLSVSYGIGVAELDTEGRVITLEYPDFYLVTCYTPNAQRELARIDHRMRWEDAFRGYLQKLDKQKPVILCGDLNVAHQEIDLKNPASNRGNAGFSDEERGAFTNCWKQDLQIPSAMYILTPPINIPGGAICLRPENGIPDGGLTISWFQTACSLVLKML